ncbi:NUDIX domain-containing protein [Streptomyces antibioticus]|uniref:NUDIX hydrolase n=1 Tax=Streptomyces antibioticus TaxID=1890 RepID=UPI00369FC45B
MRALGEAATVVLLRDAVGGPEVLLLHRPAHGSYPGVWVFPGGAVEPADRAAEGTCAVRYAAVRETREETGLVLAASELDVLSCWVPPPRAPKQLRTWFFLGPAPPGPVVTDPREAVGHLWLTPAEALRAHGESRLDLLPPTWVTLHDLIVVPTAGAARERARTGEPRHYEGREVSDPDAGPAIVWADDAAHPEGVPPDRPGPRHRLLTGSRPWTYLTTHRGRVPRPGAASGLPPGTPP